MARFQRFSSLCGVLLLAAAVFSQTSSFAMTVPAGADEFSLDKPHTEILFSVSHLGFSRSWGKFTDYQGTLALDRNHPAQAALEVTINTASVDMGDAAWDTAVKKIFHPDKYPTMTFKSAGASLLSKTTADVTGSLTLLGVTKPVTLHVTSTKCDRNPFGKYVCGFSATTDIKRSDFGMTDFLTPAGPAVGDEVHVILEVEADRKDKPGQRQFNQ